MRVVADPYTELRDRLFDAELLFSTGVEGLYGRSDTYEDIADAVGHLMHRWGRDVGATVVHVPPLIPRSIFDSTDYIRSFPDLAGSVHVFNGGDRDHAEIVRRVSAEGDWSALFEPGEIVLSPAACYSLYPMCAGRLPVGGRYFEVSGYCFRHEPSTDPTRMQAFKMHEIVYIGEPDTAQRHRDDSLARGLSILTDIGLDVTATPANDPFFGRLGTALAAGQLDEELKFEGVAPIFSDDRPTAIMSASCHRDHFGRPFGIETAAGEVAHSAGIGFGVDRITIALLVRHGLDPATWPGPVRDRLFP